MALSKEQILTALSAWIRQRPGLEFGNYGELSAYRAELRQIAKDKRDAETLLAAVAIRDSITAEDMLAGFRAFSGRLSIIEQKDGAALTYCTGQYWPTEYRKAAAAVLASVLWERKRADVAETNAGKAGIDRLGDLIRASFKREFGRSRHDLSVVSARGLGFDSRAILYLTDDGEETFETGRLALAGIRIAPRGARG